MSTQGLGIAFEQIHLLLNHRDAPTMMELAPWLFYQSGRMFVRQRQGQSYPETQSLGL